MGVWCVPWLGKEGGEYLMGPDEQPSVQKWTITDCHHPPMKGDERRQLGPGFQAT